MESKVERSKRALAYLIDSVVAGIAGAIVGFIIPTLGGLVAAAYMLLRDGLEMPYMDRRSFGKQVMNLRPLRTDGEPMDIETSMRRNWMFALAHLLPAAYGFGSLRAVLSLAAGLIVLYEVYRVLTDPLGRRWGDELAGTQVVDED